MPQHNFGCHSIIVKLPGERNLSWAVDPDWCHSSFEVIEDRPFAPRMIGWRFTSCPCLSFSRNWQRDLCSGVWLCTCHRVFIYRISKRSDLYNFDPLLANHVLEQSPFSAGFSFLLDLILSSRRSSVVRPTIMMSGLISSCCFGAVLGNDSSVLPLFLHLEAVLRWSFLVSHPRRQMCVYSFFLAWFVLCQGHWRKPIMSSLPACDQSSVSAASPQLINGFLWRAGGPWNWISSSRPSDVRHLLYTSHVHVSRLQAREYPLLQSLEYQAGFMALIDLEVEGVYSFLFDWPVICQFSGLPSAGSASLQSLSRSSWLAIPIGFSLIAILLEGVVSLP